MTIALIDADMVLFPAMAGCQRSVEWAPDVWTYWVDIGEARDVFWDRIEQLVQETSADDLLLCFTDNSRFRRILFPDYKANRKQPKPPGYKVLRDELIDHGKAYWHVDLEADDALSIAASRCRREGVDHVVCSGDKDLFQIPGMHYWPWRDPAATCLTEEESAHQLAVQQLTGDRTDNIAGLPGVGPVTAAKLLAKHPGPDDWRKVQAIWHKRLKGRPRDEIDQQWLRCSQLVSLLTEENVDADGVPHPWLPTSPHQPMRAVATPSLFSRLR